MKQYSAICTGWSEACLFRAPTIALRCSQYGLAGPTSMQLKRPNIHELLNTSDASPHGTKT
eukprot:12665691-Alexandrium_andersonii.AAC.1